MFLLHLISLGITVNHGLNGRVQVSNSASHGITLGVQGIDSKHSTSPSSKELLTKVVKENTDNTYPQT